MPPGLTHHMTAPPDRTELLRELPELCGTAHFFEAETTTLVPPGLASSRAHAPTRSTPVGQQFLQQNLNQNVNEEPELATVM